MLNVERLLASELWALSSGDELKAAIGLWCRAWKQVPAGSLPDNDRVLASFSGAGGKWSKIKDMALRGFVKCSDGRLYHPVLCADVKRALDFHERYRERREKDAERLRKWREKRDGNFDETRFETSYETGTERVRQDKDRTKTGQDKGSVAPPKRFISKSEREESVAAREQEKSLVVDDPIVRPFGPPPQAPKPSNLKNNIKSQLVQKLMRYCNARMNGDEKDRAVVGLIGGDEAHDAQWWLNEIDRRRKREGWDDTRERKHKHNGAAR